MQSELRPLNSNPSVRGATAGAASLIASSAVSIHAPREGSGSFQHAANPFPSALTVGGVHQSGRMEGAFFFQQPEQLPRGFPDMKASVSRKSAATRQE